MVHGAEGTDSTLLMTSLAQLILDPLSRTMAGFQELVKREWIQVSGHSAPALPFHPETSLPCAHHSAPLPRLDTPSSCTVPTQPSPMPTPSMKHPPFSFSWTACGSWAASSCCRWNLGRACCWRCLNTPMPPLLALSSAIATRRGELRGCQGGSGGRYRTGLDTFQMSFSLRETVSSPSLPSNCTFPPNFCKPRAGWSKSNPLD